MFCVDEVVFVSIHMCVDVSFLYDEVGIQMLLNKNASKISKFYF